MKQGDRREMIGLIAEAFDQVMLPHINEIKGILAEHTTTLAEHTKMLTEHSEILEDHSSQLESIEHKVDSTILRVDRRSQKLRI